MARKEIQRFLCYWCRRSLGLRKLHHTMQATVPPRACCSTCHADPEGHYRKIYPGGSTEELESVARAQRRELEDSR